MPTIESFEMLDEEIQKIPGKPTVLEALWDGDTTGWFLLLYLYTSEGGWFLKKRKRHFLGDLTLGGDIRLFNEQVPPWPETQLAKELASKAQNKYGLTFYMPSEEPDDSCPSWEKRHLGIHCGECNKLIIPATSPYLPKDICYSCHLKREFQNNPETEGS